MKVYSYLRFSTPEQAMGDSERRQLEAARTWADRKGLVLDESLQPDRGLSGFHGANRKRGALGEFLRRVEAGEVPRGSILLVENIDRLSREGVASTLRHIIFQLWDYDITIQTLSPEQTYGPGCSESPEFLALFLYMQRAHAESALKSSRGKSNWQQKRKLAREGVKLTRKAPDWLVWKNEQWKVIREAKRTIQRMFKLRADGKGCRTIAKELNQDKAAWKRRNGWHSSYVARILSNRAVLGELQPKMMKDGKQVPDGEPVLNAFPRIIEPGVFHAAQKLRQADSGTGGRIGKVGNLFTKLAKCPYCSGAMTYVPKDTQYRYLVCCNAKRGRGCSYQCVPYDAVERLVLENSTRLKPEQVMPSDSKLAKLRAAAVERCADLRNELGDLETQANNLVDMAAREKVAAVRDRVSVRLAEIESRKVDREKELADAERELAACESGAKSFKDWQAGLAAILEHLDNPEVRLRLRTHLRSFIERIEVFPLGHKTEWDLDTQDGDDLGEYVDAHGLQLDPKFLKYALQQRMSKRGWFVRVHFKNSSPVSPAVRAARQRGDSGIDLVPEGSLATGFRNGKWVTPDLNALLQEFEQLPASRATAGRQPRRKVRR